MLGRILVGFLAVKPLNKVVWRVFYDYVALRCRAVGRTFMNYGYAAEGGDTLVLEAVDEPDRLAIQLYDLVTSTVELRGLDVLEVGSGCGGGASYIARSRRPKRTIGLDLSKSAVEYCRSHHRVAGLEFERGDAENLPFGSQSFDAVVNVESSHHYPSPARFFGEVRRVLRIGGYFLYADFWETSVADEWRRSLESSGLALISERDITAQVLTAFERDNDGKRAAIERVIPGPLRRAFLNVAAVRGSSIHRAFVSKALSYRSFVMRRTS